MEKGNLLYRGKAKSVYETDNPDYCIIEFRNDLTAGNGLRKGQFERKGAINMRISNIIFAYLAENNIPTHFVEEVDEVSNLTKKLGIIPLEVIIRNYAAGSFCRNFGYPQGEKFPIPVFELCYKNDELGDPLINDDHAVVLGLATKEQLGKIREYTFKINELLSDLFAKMDLTLIDFKIEFGSDADGNILLADEISPDSCRLWTKDGSSLDKDLFRKDLGGFEDAYAEVLRRLENVRS